MHYLVANLISLCALTLVRFAIADRVMWRERDERHVPLLASTAS